MRKRFQKTAWLITNIPDSKWAHLSVIKEIPAWKQEKWIFAHGTRAWIFLAYYFDTTIYAVACVKEEKCFELQHQLFGNSRTISRNYNTYHRQVLFYLFIVIRISDLNFKYVSSAISLSNKIWIQDKMGSSVTKIYIVVLIPSNANFRFTEVGFDWLESHVKVTQLHYHETIPISSKVSSFLLLITVLLFTLESCLDLK